MATLKFASVYHPNGEFYTFSIWTDKGELVFSDSAEYRTKEAAEIAAQAYLDAEK